MKKITKLFLALFLFSMVSFVPAIPVTAEEDSIKVSLDGEFLVFDQAPVMQNNRVMVPVRAIFEALGATVNYDAETRSVTAVKNDSIIKLTIGSTKASINDSTVTLDQPPIILKSRTLVPVRFVSEALGAEVQWIQDTKTVTINRKEDEEKGATPSAIENTFSVQYEYAPNGATKYVTYFMNGKRIASFDYSDFNIMYGNGWSLKLTRTMASKYIEFGFGLPGSTQLINIYSPYEIRIKSTEKSYSTSNSNAWKDDPYVIENHLEPAISYVLQYLVDLKRKLTIDGYR